MVIAAVDSVSLPADLRTATGPTTSLRVVSWNLNHWRQPLLPIDTRRGAWDDLATRTRAQVVLVQEAVPPADVGIGRSVYGEIAGHRDWGSGVVALDPAISIEPIRSVRIPYSRRRYLLTNTLPGAVAIARVSIPQVSPITIISIYGIWDGPVVSNMLRVIADLVPLFDSPDGARVILGGDFNVSTATTDARSLARGEAIFAAVRSLGLVAAKDVADDPPLPIPDCPCRMGRSCGHIATWGRADLDHLFVSPALASQVVGLDVDPTVVAAGLSDHAPLILDLDLSREATPHGWDEETLAGEIGRRHGSEARRVVERLVNWAFQKERALAAVAGLQTRTLSRFPTNGITTEPELWWQLDFELEPKGSQPLISIQANGDVIVQLEAMRHPPFDEPEARDSIRRELSGLDGLDIRGASPDRFPIGMLASEANLLGFVAVLNRLVEETRPRVPVAA